MWLLHSRGVHLTIMDGVPSKISIFSELTVSSDSETEESDDNTVESGDVTRHGVTAGPVQAWAECKKAPESAGRCVRIPYTMNEEDEDDGNGRRGDKNSGCHGNRGGCDNKQSGKPPLVVRLSKQLPQALVDRNKAQEKSIVLKEKRKREMISRRKEELALERKLKFKPRYIHITPPPEPKPKPAQKPETQLFLKTPQSPRRPADSALDFSSLMNVKSLSSANSGLSQEDIDAFVRQSQLTRDMLKINFKENKLSIVFDEKAEKCEHLLRKEIRRHKARKNPTYCIIK